MSKEPVFITPADAPADTVQLQEVLTAEGASATSDAAVSAEAAPSASEPSTSQPLAQSVSLFQGDVLDKLKAFPDAHFDALFCDPPYGLSDHGDIAPVLQAWLSGEPYKHPKKGFMGKDWDAFVPGPEVWREVYRVLKPGAFCLVFAGSRTQDLMGLSLRLAGFELKDTLAYVHAQGFPKSHNIAKAITAQLTTGGSSPRNLRKVRQGEAYSPTGQADYKKGRAFSAEVEHDNTPTELVSEAKVWDGYGTQMKPAYEPCLLVQKPLDKTYAHNALTHGCGGLNIDGCRIEEEVVAVRGGDENTEPFFGGGFKQVNISSIGRYPANLVLSDEAAQALDESHPNSKSGGPSRFFQVVPAEETDPVLNEYAGFAETLAEGEAANRFKYCAKVSTKERNAGLAEFPDKDWAGEGACIPERANRPFLPSKNAHPTLKALALTEYFARLLLVPARADGQPRRILVPFAGTSSEVIGCLKAGWDEVAGIELSQEYVGIGEVRIKHWVPGAKVSTTD